MKTLDEMKEDYLKTNQIKYIGRKKKPKFETSDILTVYSGHTIEKVL
jgi:hypothetical protein